MTSPTSSSPPRNYGWANSYLRTLPPPTSCLWFARPESSSACSFTQTNVSEGKECWLFIMFKKSCLIWESESRDYYLINPGRFAGIQESRAWLTTDPVEYPPFHSGLHSTSTVRHRVVSLTWTRASKEHSHRVWVFIIKNPVLLNPNYTQCH